MAFPPCQSPDRQGSLERHDLKIGESHRLQPPRTADIATEDAYITLEFAQVIAAFRPRRRGSHHGWDDIVRLVYKTRAFVHARVSGAQRQRHGDKPIAAHTHQLPRVGGVIRLDVGDGEKLTNGRGRGNLLQCSGGQQHKCQQANRFQAGPLELVHGSSP